MTSHNAVLLKEAIESLNIKKGDTVVDATLGGGGHSRKILEVIGDEGTLIAIDRDVEAIGRFAGLSSESFAPEQIVFKKDNLILVHENFCKLKDILDSLNIKNACLPVGKVDAILADFGISSDQLDSNERGFSFLSDADLDMRMDNSCKEGNDLTAENILNEYSKEELIRIFREYGEEQYASQIAKNIIESRKEKKIKTTFELVEIISSSIPLKYKHKKIHFATKIFQALRIEVNDELKSIDKFTRDAIDVLKTGKRLVVISFHSGEDRVVKDIFKKEEKDCVCPPEFPVCRCEKESRVKIITKKPVVASEDEISDNPRSRSAKMRVIEKK
jgi:16S rRNA (cytosine1402-N4)-methyltransferase